MAVRHSAWRFSATVEPPTLHQYKVPMPNPLDTPSFDLSPLCKPTSCMVPIGGGHNDQCSISHAHHLIPRFPRGFPTYAHLLHFLSDDLFIPKLTDGEFDSNTSSGRLGLSQGGLQEVSHYIIPGVLAVDLQDQPVTQLCIHFEKLGQYNFTAGIILPTINNLVK